MLEGQAEVIVLASMASHGMQQSWGPHQTGKLEAENELEESLPTD